MAWSDGILDDIRRRIGLADLIARRVKLERRGREHTGLCPFHNEKTPSFTVNEEKGFYHCFGCGAHGDAFDFVMRTQGVDFPEAVETLARETGVTLPADQHSDPKQQEKKAGLYDVLEAAQAWFEAQLADSRGEAAQNYLGRRGLKAETVERFHIGFAPDSRNSLKNGLLGKGFSEDLLIEAGLLIKPEGGGGTYDRFRNRVIFPISDARGRPVAFGGRTLGEDRAKYLNSPETPLFQKGRMLYAWALSRSHMHKTGQGLIVEGYMDVIALHQAGMTTAVAPLGTALTEDQIRLLWKAVDEPALCFDGDAAGLRAAARVVDRALPLLKPGKSLRFAMLPSGEDPDSLIAKQGVEVMEGCIQAAPPMVDLVWRGLAGNIKPETPERWADLKRRIQQTTGQIADTGVQDEYRRALTDRFWRMRRSDDGKSKPWAADMPADMPMRRARRESRERHLDIKILLALVLAHPWLMNEVGEELGRLDIHDADLDRLRQAMIEYPEPQQLDKVQFIRQLERIVGVQVVKALNATAVQIHLECFGSGSSRDEVRQFWRERVGFSQISSLRAEVQAAKKKMLDQHGGDSDYRRFTALKRRLMEEESLMKSSDIGELSR